MERVGAWKDRWQKALDSQNDDELFSVLSAVASLQLVTAAQPLLQIRQK